MNQFQYVRVNQAKSAVDVLGKSDNAKFIAGGTNLIDLMKRGVEAPDKLIDINRLPLNKI